MQATPTVNKLCSAICRIKTKPAINFYLIDFRVDGGNSPRMFVIHELSRAKSGLSIRGLINMYLGTALEGLMLSLSQKVGSFSLILYFIILFSEILVVLCTVTHQIVA